MRNPLSPRAWLAVGIAAGVTSIVLVLHSYSGDPFVNQRDLAIDHAAVRTYLHGGSAFGDVQTMLTKEIPGYHAAILRNGAPLDLPQWHQPARLLLHMPLAPLSFTRAAIAWALVSAAALATALYLFGRGIGWDPAVSLAVACGLLAAPLVYKDLLFGQVEAVLLLLMVLAWLSLRAGREVRAGVLLGVAGAIKLYPLFFLLPLLRKRRYPAVPAALIAAAVVFMGAWVALGADSHSFSQIGDLGDWQRSTYNMAFSGVVLRTLPDARWLSYLVSAASIVACWVLAAREDADPLWTAAPFCLLALPITWSGYFIVALPWWLLSMSRSDGWRRAAFAAIGLGILIHVQGLSENNAILTIPTLLLLAAIVVMYARGSHPARAVRPGVRV